MAFKGQKRLKKLKICRAELPAGKIIKNRRRWMHERPGLQRYNDLG